MEAHIIEIVRFTVCIIAVMVAILFMVKADDNNIMRRISVSLAVLLIYFNEQIGAMIYLLIGSTLESLIAVMGVLFVVTLAMVVMIFPLVALIRWAIH